MKKQKVYWGLVIAVVIIVVLGIFFYQKTANAPTEPTNQNMAGQGIPANMSISDELGG